MERLKGIPASPGVAVAPVFLFRTEAVQLARRDIAAVGQEIERLQDSIAEAAVQIESIQARTAQKMGEAEASVFSAHLLFLEDPTLVDAAKERIRAEKVCAEWAFQTTGDEIASMLDAVDDPYLAERASDVRDVVSRVVRILTGQAAPSLSSLAGPSIVVAKDLTPSQTAAFDPRLVVGLAIEEGGPTSHTVILARTLGIPAVVGMAQGADRVSHGEQAILDGNSGELTLRPDAAALLKAKMRASELTEQKERRRVLIGLPSQTADGERLELAANIGVPAEVSEALRWGAEGIGLFRTEFLYMDRRELPNEEEQFEAYQQVLRTMGPSRPVIFRTLDIGGDKGVDALNLPREANPFLGLRAIRICLQDPDLFKVQLRALLRASAHGRVRIMYPMVQSVKEVLDANRILEQARSELQSEGTAVGRIEVGMMIEVPAAVTIVDLLAPHVDFFSIGTNDLIQYALAVDRMNSRVAHLYQPFHPAILRMIGRTCTAAHQASKWVGVCGEMAGDPVAAPVLLGLGLDEFSMSAPALPAVKEALRATRRSDAKTFAASLVKMSDPVEIRQRAEEYYRNRLEGA